MKRIDILDQIANLEAQKQNISNQAAFSVGQQIQPIDAKIQELRNELIRSNSEVPPSSEAAPAPAAKRRGRPRKNVETNGDEAVAS